MTGDYIPVWVALAVGLPGTISAILGFISNRTQARNHAQTAETLQDLQRTTNGKMDALLRVTGAAEHAKGVIEGRQEEKGKE